MKKILLSLIAIMATLSINAQRVKVYENGSLSATYTNSSTNTVKVVAEEVPDYVEIGGVKWATKNLGATTVAGSPSTCYGDYYAWGETEPRYTSITFETIDNEITATGDGWKSEHSSGYSSSDYPTYTGTTLDADHDAATQNWGSNWRTPTSADFEALAEACNGSSINDNLPSISSSTPTGGIYWLPSDQTYLSDYTGVAGILFVDQTDTSKRVFFPAAGNFDGTDLYEGGSKGYYWSSTLVPYGPNDAFGMYFDTYIELYSHVELGRCYGFPVRPVSSTDEQVAQVVKVYENGTLSATYTNSSTNIVKVVFEEAPAAPSHAYVEIGGLKWATMNLGATTIAGDPSTCYGDYYAWGETEPRYTSITISSDGTSATFGGWSSSHSSGYSDSDYPSYTGTTLDADHDAATQNWGSDWRTPTNADFQALAKACTGSSDNEQTPSTLSTSSPTGGIYWLSSDQTYLSEYTGVAGILFVDKTDTSKRVFFPAAGYCYDTIDYGGSDGLYWSSSLNTSGTNYAYNLYFDSWDVSPSNYSPRCLGVTVRPVSDEDAATDANLIQGKFSVSDSKQVQFTKGNLYWDGSAFKFEANQTDYQASWNTSHVSHFYWTKTAGDSYAESYGISDYTTTDKFFADGSDADHQLTIDGTTGLYTLTKAEWSYLFKTRANASSLHKYGVTVTDNGTSYTGCVIIAPDGYTGELQSSYTLDEVNAAGLVCLPSAGHRNGSEFSDVESYGHYWSATPAPDESNSAYNLYFPSFYVAPDGSDYRTWGCSLRLVK